MSDLREPRQPSPWFRRLVCFFGATILLIVVAGVIRNAIEIYRHSQLTDGESPNESTMPSSLPHVRPFTPLAKPRRSPAKLPPEFAEFYAKNEGHCPEIPEYIVGLYPLKNVAAGMGRIVPWLASVYEDEPGNPWLRAEVVLLGQDSFGDDIFYARSTPVHPDGGIYIGGRDAAGPEDSTVQDSRVLCVASTFASWLEHLRANDWIEYGIVPGEMKTLSKAKRDALRRYYLELNPKLNW